jgi:hypothetical protein
MTNSATFCGSVIPAFNNRAETKSDECSDATTGEVSEEEEGEESSCPFKDLAKIQEVVETINAVESISGFNP